VRRNVLKARLAWQIVHWLLLAVVVLYFITGFGITQFRVVEFLTFGLLTKSLSFQIHDNLWVPFVVLLGLHIYQWVYGRKNDV
jgi:hypothetical protein